MQDSNADLRSESRARSYPMRIQHDAATTYGYMHAGYPIMTFMDVVNTTITGGGLRSAEASCCQHASSLRPIQPVPRRPTCAWPRPALLGAWPAYVQRAASEASGRPACFSATHQAQSHSLHSRLHASSQGNLLWQELIRGACSACCLDHCILLRLLTPLAWGVCSGPCLAAIEPRHPLGSIPRARTQPPETRVDLGLHGRGELCK